MSTELAQDLATAIFQQNPMIADSLGLPLSGRELRAIYEIVGERYLRDKATRPFLPSIADLLRIYELLAPENLMDGQK